MPARREELHHVKEEGLDFQLLTNPMEDPGNQEGWGTGLKCVRMELGEADASGRHRPVEIAGSEFVLDVDAVLSLSARALILWFSQPLRVLKPIKEAPIQKPALPANQGYLPAAIS